MDALRLFLPIVKVDAAKRLVYGQVAAEVADKANEIFDYASSKPLFEAWSAEIHKNSEGKSLGNLRAMHGHVAAGKLTSIAFDDPGKQIEAVAKVVDDAEWAKVVEGVYTGFSIGGKYEKRWKDETQADLTRYTANPHEVSLVDSPCIPTATFSMVKADGTTETRKFKAAEAEAAAVEDKPAAATITNEQIVAKAQELATADGKPKQWGLYVEAAGTALAKAAKDASTATDPAAAADPPVTVADAAAASLTATDAAKAAGAAPAVPAADLSAEGPDAEQVWKARDGSVHKTKAEALAQNAKASAAAVAAPLATAIAGLTGALDKAEGKEAADPAVDPAVEKKDYSVDERKKMAGSGEAMKDGSFPIKNKADLKNAIQAYGRAKNKTAAKKHIIARAKALGATDELPDGWTKKITKLERVDELSKDLYTVARLANLLQELDWLQDSTEYEAEYEKDNSAVPAALKASVLSLAAVLRDMVTEETAELISDDDAAEFGGILELAAGKLPHGHIDGLVKLLAPRENPTLDPDASLAPAQILEFQKIWDARAVGDKRLTTARDAIAKAGARHSSADKARINKAHDLLVEAGADCSAEKDAGAVDLTKVAAENVELRKQMADAVDLIKGVTERLAKIEALPQEGRPSSTNVTIVSKEDDVRDAAAEVLKNTPLEQLGLAAIRIAQGNPGRMFARGQ